MTRTCKVRGCDREVGADEDYESRRYCSVQHEVKYEHIKADADDAWYEEQREVHHDDVPRGSGFR